MDPSKTKKNNKKNKTTKNTLYFVKIADEHHFEEVVGCGEGVGYLTSPGHPTDIGFQLG